MLSFLTQIFSQFLSKLHVVSEQLGGMLRKSKSTQEDVAKMHKIHIKNSLAREIDDTTRVVSAVSSPERDAMLNNQLKTSSRHSETIPPPDRRPWTQQTAPAARKSVTMVDLLGDLETRRKRAEANWKGGGRSLARSKR